MKRYGLPVVPLRHHRCLVCYLIPQGEIHKGPKRVQGVSELNTAVTRPAGTDMVLSHMMIQNTQSLTMLTITKLGIQALSRFAKEQDVSCPCIYRGLYNPDGNPHEHAFVTTSNTILSEGYWCSACNCIVEFEVFCWSWKDGLKKASFSSKTLLSNVIDALLVDMPMLSHIAIMEIHDDMNMLYVYKYDPSND